jgi:hypothetical protein
VETLTGIGGFCKKNPETDGFLFFFCPHFGAYGLCTPPPGSAQPPLFFFFSNVRVFANFREQICKNHMRQNAGKEK